MARLEAWVQSRMVLSSLLSVGSMGRVHESPPLPLPHPLVAVACVSFHPVLGPHVCQAHGPVGSWHQAVVSEGWRTAATSWTGGIGSHSVEPTSARASRKVMLWFRSMCV